MIQESSKTNVIVNSFSRIEDKYVLPKKFFPEFLSVLEKHLKKSYGSIETEGSEDTGNQSIYFDSEQVECFQQHFAKLDSRFKLRIRRYRVNGRWDDKVIFVECKCKNNGTSSKQRFLLTNYAFDVLMLGGEIEVTPQLISLNLSMKKETLLRRVQEFNQIVRRLKARPKLIVEYQRVAYEKDELRVTIDRSIKTMPLGVISSEVGSQIRDSELWSQSQQMKTVFDNQTHCLIEIKHSGSHPEWFDEFMARNAMAETSFSKYCWGMTQAIEGVDVKPQEKDSRWQHLDFTKPASELKGEQCSLAVL